MHKRGVFKLPKDDEHTTRWCWSKRFEDGKVGYIQLLIYFDGSVKYSEFTIPKLKMVHIQNEVCINLIA